MSLNEIVTGDHEEKELHKEIEVQSNAILHNLTSFNYQLTVLITGGCQSGKTSLIRNFFGKDAAENLDKKGIVVGSNGAPTTQHVILHPLPDKHLNLIDTPGLEKDRTVNRARQVINEIRTKNLEPSIILIVLNYLSSIEEVELELVKSFPNIPVLLILNKVDLLQDYKTELANDSSCLEQFDQLSESQFPQWILDEDIFMKKLINVRKRLFKWRDNHVTIRRILITSLRSERKTDEPIGLDEVCAAMWGCLDAVGRTVFSSALQQSKRSKIALSVSIIMAAAASAAGK